MSDPSEVPAGTGSSPRKKGRKPVAAGAILGLLLGGTGYYAAISGMLPLSGSPDSPDSAVAETAGLAAFVPLDPIVLSLGPGSSSRHLKFTAQIEVFPAFELEVSNMRPRILDIMNTYLRAIDEAELEEAASLVKIRMQLLRRIQIVTGDGRVKDLLITEFVLT